MLLLVAPGQALSAEAQAAQDLVHLVLGGMFTSRLNLKLREEKGYTYGAGSGAPHLRGPYRQEASAAVQAEVTVAAPIDDDQRRRLQRAADGAAVTAALQAFAAHQHGRGAARTDGYGRCRTRRRPRGATS